MSKISETRVVFENGKFVLKNFMSTRDYDNIVIVKDLRDKMVCEPALNQAVKDLMIAPFDELSIDCPKSTFKANVFIEELIELLRPYGFTISHRFYPHSVQSGGFTIRIRLKKINRFSLFRD
jgi:hypothetical protein